MAWIVGLVSRDELVALRAAGWEDDAPPAGLRPPGETEADELVTRAFFVDSDVYTIMSGADWAPVQRVVRKRNA